MATRGRGGSSKTIAKRAVSKRKQLCELGTSCPYQHEYQHQQEFSHDNTPEDTPGSAKAARAKSGRKTKRTLAQHTSGVLRGTGSRGRVVAVASDRRRAERAATRDGDSLGDDPRGAQRARWVRQMQGELMQQQQQQQRAAPRKVAPIESTVQSVLDRGHREQDRRRRVEHVEILVSSDSDNDVEDDGKGNINSSCSSASSTTAAAFPRQPKSREWNCKACTFRNSNTKGLACAVCSFKRV